MQCINIAMKINFFYSNFFENIEKSFIAQHVHDVNMYILINISINIPHFAEFHILPTSSVRDRKTLNRIKSIRVYNLVLFKVFLSRTLTSKKIYVLIHISFNFHPFKLKLKRWTPLRVRVMKIYLRCPEFEKVFYWIFVTLTLRYAHSSSLSSNG